MATIKLTIQSDFDQASADLKSFGTLTEKEAKRIEKFVNEFSAERIDKFTEKNKRAAAAVTATSGTLAGMQKEYRGLKNEIERLIRNGMDPQDDKIKVLRDRYVELEREIKDANEAQNNQSKSSAFAIKSFTDLAVAGKVAIDAFKKIYAVARDLEDAYFQQERAVVTLEAALRASGQEVETNSAAMQSFASEMQKVTTVGDEVSIGLLQIATSAGLTADQAQQATKDAIGLSKAFGVSLESAIKATTNAQQGNYDLLNRYIPAVKNASDETEKAAIAQKSLAQAFQVATAEGETAYGIQEQLNNAWGDAKEFLGSYISEALRPLKENLLETVTGLTAFLQKTKEAKEANEAFANGTATVDQEIMALTAQLVQQNQAYAAAKSLGYAVNDVYERNIDALEEQLAQAKQKLRWSALQAQYDQQEVETKKEVVAQTEDEVEIKNELISTTKAITAEAEKRVVLLNDEILAEVTRSEIEEAAAAGREARAAKEKADLEELIALRFQYANATLGIFQAIDALSSATSAAELQRLEEEGASEEELAQKKKEIARDEAKRQKKLSLFEIAINTASAIVEALPNVVLAALAGTTGAIQAAAVMAQPIPTAQTGTMSPITIPDTGRGNDNVAVMAAPGEQVSVTPRGQGEMMQMINVYLQNQVLFSAINEGIRSGEIRITAQNIQGGAA